MQKQEKTAELSTRIALMAEIHTRRLSDRALAFWVEALEPLYGPELIQALDAGCKSQHMPSLGDILQMTMNARARSKKPKGPAEWAQEDAEAFAALPAEERQRREREAREFFEGMRAKLGYTP